MNESPEETIERSRIEIERAKEEMRSLNEESIEFRKVAGISFTAKVIRFYRSTGQYGFLSNLYPCKVTVTMTTFQKKDDFVDLLRGKSEDITFDSVEHGYQYLKPNKQEISEWIRNAPHPRLASIAGHGLLSYDVSKGWDKVKVDWMLALLRLKFQNPELRKKLLETGDAYLIENSKTDSFWGAGKNGKGKNQLGILLMMVREEIKRA